MKHPLILLKGTTLGVSFSIGCVMQSAQAQFIQEVDYRLGTELSPENNGAEFRYLLGLPGGFQVHIGDILQISLPPQPVVSGPVANGLRLDETPYVRNPEFNPACGGGVQPGCADRDLGFFMNTGDTAHPPYDNVMTTSGGVQFVQPIFRYTASANVTVPEARNFGYFTAFYTGHLVGPEFSPPFAVFNHPTATLFDASGNARFSVTAGPNPLIDPAALRPFMVPAIPGPIVPHPTQVPGKEYSDRPDIDAAHVPSPEQTLLWDGLGNVRNGFKYGSTGEVDEMANVNDTLYDAVIKDKAALLFSTTGDAPAPIMFERRMTGGGGIWAIPTEINRAGVNDLDGLEVWGPDEVANADRYSLVGDPTGVAVYDEAPFRHAAFTVAELAAAIGLDPALWDQFDLDGLMTSGDRILFSIAPLGPFDGGEIST